MSNPAQPDLQPYIQVRDVRSTIDWFEKLGFTCEMTMNMPDGSVGHAELSRGTARVMVGPVWGETGAPGINLYINVHENVDSLHDRAAAQGITIAEPPTDQFWGGRTFTVVHPDGYQLTFSQHVRDVSTEEMQAAMAQAATATA